MGAGGEQRRAIASEAAEENKGGEERRAVGVAYSVRLLLTVGGEYSQVKPRQKIVCCATAIVDDSINARGRTMQRAWM